MGLAVFTAPAQTITITSTNLSEALALAGLASSLSTNAQIKPGVPFTVDGRQAFIITTNGAGRYTVSSYGSAGTNTITVPSNPAELSTTAQTWLAANNVTNITYYGTNELDARVGVMYLQNSGQAVASVSVVKYGWFGYDKIGVGGGLLQGNDSGKTGTAGGWGELDYRKPIGDVAAEAGLMGGYDKWNDKAFVGVKVGLEYRQNAHLGEFITAAYAYEDENTDRGLLIGGGITYSF